MKLYFVTGACSLSPHIVLQELGVPYELARVDFKTKRTSDGQDFLAVNPKGAVAALQLDDGEVVTEGPAIIQYLADLKPEAKLAPANGTLARVRLQEWLNFISSELHAGVGPLFNPAVPEAAKEIAKAKLFKKLDVVEKTLAKQDYLLGEFSVADAFLFTILSWMPHFSIDLAGWPSTAAFVERIGARPSVAAARAAEDKIPKFE
jgi:glutathione S-transferase